MSQSSDDSTHIITPGEHVVLRHWLADDYESYIRWMAQGEWRLFDAPWEDSGMGPADEDAASKRERFMRLLEAWEGLEPPGRAVIATLDGIPLGWVNRYGDRGNPRVWFVGISICEDAYLNRGIGTEALGLWVDHLFAVSDVHKMCLDTWSFNPRMIRVAEKLGFVYEGRQRDMRQWQGEWLDAVHFGLLRDEWLGSRRVRGEPAAVEAESRPAQGDGKRS